MRVYAIVNTKKRKMIFARRSDSFVLYEFFYAN